MKKYYGAAVAESKSVCLHEIRRRCMHLSARICLLMLSQVRFRSFHLIKVWDYMEAAPLPSLCLHPPFLLLLLVYLFSGFFSFFFSPFFSLLGALYIYYIHSLFLSFSRYSPPLYSNPPFCSRLVIHYFDFYPSYYITVHNW